MKTKHFFVGLGLLALGFSSFAQNHYQGNYYGDHRDERRIAQGVRSGELTPMEARALQRQRNELAAMKRAARADGSVTKGERMRIERAEERLNRMIYRAKHNERDMHGRGMHGRDNWHR